MAMATNIPPHPHQTDDLHQRTEGLAKTSAAKSPESTSPKDVMSTLHELQVHQIELEMQNNELRRLQTKMEASQSRYFDLYDLAPVGHLTISEQGQIIEANRAAAILLGVDRGALVKQPLSRFIHSRGDFVDYIGHCFDLTKRKQAEERIESQLDELRRWQDVMLGREGRIQELKREVNEFCRCLGESVRYPSQEARSTDSAMMVPKT